MAEYDFFELTGLPFDPTVKTAAKKVKEAIDKKKNGINAELGAGGTQQTRRDELNAMLKCLSEYETTILSGDGNLTSEYKSLAQAREKKALDELNATIAMMLAVGTCTVTNGTVNAQKQLSGLSKETVVKAFTNTGIGIKQTKRLKEMWKSMPYNERIFDTIAALRKEKLLNMADLSGITDLYSFAAYLCDGAGTSGDIYRAKTTSELQALFDGLSKKFAGLPDNYSHLCADISTNGKTRVFNSDEARREYDLYLLYKIPKLTELFKLLKNLPPQNKIDPKYAEKCIKTISEVFGEYDIALAIYNKEAEIENDPYEPERFVFHVKCAHCQNLNEFDGEDDAKSKNKCSHCGRTLYKQCNKCHKNVLASLDKCPECGFVFAITAMFVKYFAAAEQAFRKSDFESAHSFLFQAQSADPGEKSRTDELAARIIAEEKKYEKPINDLRKLIADKMFERASGAVADIIGKFPGLNVSAFETQINTALSQARTAFANAKELSSCRQADECVAILRDCVDFKPAISYLQATPPEPCKGFAIGIDSSAGCTNISWSRSSEQGISYRLVRKQGKETPVNEKDGEVLIDDAKETSYQDKSILPGKSYSYAVFAIRFGVFSTASGKTIVLLVDVTDAHAEQMDTTVRLTWNTPKNCTGVTIRRTHNGKETVLINSAHGSFEDKEVQYGIAYSYKLCANYANLLTSQGVDVVITPMLKIDSFKICAKQLNENRYKVSWSINRRGIDLRVLVDEKQVRELKSDASSCDLELPMDGFRTITVLAYSGGSWLRSDNNLQVNTYSPCYIDKAASHFHEEAIVGLQESAYRIELKLKIGGVIPPNVVGFYYVVRTGASHNRWPTTEETGKAADIHRIGLAAYQKSGEILYTETAREESTYYVSLFTIYDIGGKEIVSNPKPCRFERPLTADLFWKVSKNILGGLKLSIEVSGNRPMVRVPELVLCVCADSQHLLSHSDPKATRLLTVPATDLVTPQKVYGNCYDVKLDLSAKKLKGTKFFLFEDSPIASENYTLRWAKGFAGKV